MQGWIRHTLSLGFNFGQWNWKLFISHQPSLSCLATLPNHPPGPKRWMGGSAPCPPQLCHLERWCTSVCHRHLRNAIDSDQSFFWIIKKMFQNGAPVCRAAWGPWLASYPPQHPSTHHIICMLLTGFPCLQLIHMRSNCTSTTCEVPSKGQGTTP